MLVPTVKVEKELVQTEKESSLQVPLGTIAKDQKQEKRFRDH